MVKAPRFFDIFFKRNRIRETAGDRVFYFFVLCVMWLAIAVTLYPFMYVLSMSLSSPVAVLKQQVWLFPIGINFGAYTRVLNERMIWVAYGNTIYYTFFGTAINVIMTIMLAYPLSRKKFMGKNVVTLFASITMLFSGGMIPHFLLIRNLGLYNTRWAMILPGAIGVYNMIIARTFFTTIPESLHESMAIDGANDLRILISVVLPLSKPIIAVLVLFYAVGHWNTYFSALLYLPNTNLHPLQMYLVRLLVRDQLLMAEAGVDALELAMQTLQTKYSTIIVVMTPIMCVYPFLQKYFAQGVMIGSIKE